MDISKRISDVLNSSKCTAIVCHQNPDGDTLGSAFALSDALSQINIANNVLCQDILPHKYNIFDKIPIINKFDKNKYDIIVFLDCAEIMLSGALLDGINFNDFITINIDHHITNSNYAKLNFVDSTYSSTAELVLELIKKMDIRITKEIAEYIYIAIITDTGQFAYSYTSSRTHINAAFLLNCDVDFSSLHEKLFKTIPLRKVLLQKQMLNNMNILEKGKIAISTLSNEDFSLSNATPQDSESLVNILLSIENVKIAVLIRQTDKNRCKASFRSVDDVDISIVAKFLNGGGHKQAAGATLEYDIKNAQKIILKTIFDTGILK